MARTRRGVASPAVLRTINLFDGKTDEERAAEMAAEEAQTSHKDRSAPELELQDKVRDEWMTLNYTSLDGWRLSKENGRYLLQKIGLNGASTTSVVLPGGDQFLDLAKQFYLAAKKEYVK